MSRSDNHRSGSGELSTIIGPDADIVGNLTVKHSLRVDGKVQGQVESQETVTIGSSGSVQGDITARDIILGGKVTGKLNASGKTLLEASSSLTGDLKTSRLVVEEGAVFNGMSEMGEAAGRQAHAPGKINLEEE